MIEGYLRRRAWGAFHAGYGVHVKDADYTALLGRKVEKPAMSPEQMLANLRRHAVAQNARLARRAATRNS